MSRRICDTNYVNSRDFNFECEMKKKKRIKNTTNRRKCKQKTPTTLPVALVVFPSPRDNSKS